MKLTPEWISGFVDGDHCFHMQPITGSDRLTFRFLVSQHDQSTDLLYALKTHFGCGTVHKAGGKIMEYQISNRLHLRDKVISHFQKYPLQTGKRHSFQNFAHTLWAYMKAQGEDPGRITDSFPGDFHLSNGWFRGFVDAEGCFSISLVNNQCIPRFSLGESDAPLIRECQKWLGCGACRSGKDGLEMLEISAVEDLENRLFPLLETRGSAVLLRTMKRIAFQKFRKIVRLMVEKRHLTAQGMEKIKKLQQNLQKFTPLVKSEIQH